jgi:hypothetical protein
MVKYKTITNDRAKQAAISHLRSIQEENESEEDDGKVDNDIKTPKSRSASRKKD